MADAPNQFYDRDLSWLSFNGRILEEAADLNVPLYERLKFLAIFSSNLDEFFRVRVALLRSLISAGGQALEGVDNEPEALLDQIKARVLAQQEELGASSGRKSCRGYRPTTSTSCKRRPPPPNSIATLRATSAAG